MGGSAYFTSTERKNDVYFPYPWKEWDSITIHLPQGFELDHAESPGEVDFPPAGEYWAKIFINRSTNTLTYERSLTFGKDDRLLYKPAEYPILKAAFDKIHTSDEHIVSLRETEREPVTQE